LDMTPVQFDVQANQSTPQSFPVQARVYDHQSHRWLDEQPLEVDAGLLDQQIKIKLEKKQAVGTKGEAHNTLSFHFPDVMSNTLVSAFDRFDHVKKLVFLDANDQPVYQFDPDSQDDTVELRV